MPPMSEEEKERVASIKRYTFFFTAKGLTNLRTFGTSYPRVELLAPSSWESKPYWVGNTEAIPSCLDPEWKEGITVTLHGDKPYTIELRDVEGGAFCGNKVIGTAVLPISQLISEPGTTATLDVDTGGTITVSFEDTDYCQDLMRVEFYGRNMRKMGAFGTSPYLVLMRINPNGTRKEIWRTETKEDVLSPNWRVSTSLSVAKMHCGDAEAQTLEVQCWGARSSIRGDVSLGYFKCSVMDLWRAGQAGTGVSTCPGFRLLKDKNDNLEDAYGDIYVRSMKWIEYPDFEKCIASGQKRINLITSMGFVGGLPLEHGYLSAPEFFNDRLLAMKDICPIFMEYVSDKQSSVYGYDAFVDDERSEFFSLTDAADGKVTGGVDGVIDTVTQFLSTCKPGDGCEHNAPTIHKVIDLAHEAAKANSVYTVLVIYVNRNHFVYNSSYLKHALKRVANAPISIIFVGFGDPKGPHDPKINEDGVRERVQIVPYLPVDHADHESVKKRILSTVVTQFEQHYYDQHLAFDPCAVATTPV